MTDAILASRLRDSVTENIIESVARAEGVPPEKLTIPLYDAIDPDALERLFNNKSPSSQSIEITFLYYGYRVTVSDDKSVSLMREG